MNEKPNPPTFLLVKIRIMQKVMKEIEEAVTDRLMKVSL